MTLGINNHAPSAVYNQVSEQQTIQSELFNAIESGEASHVISMLSTHQIDLAAKNDQGKTAFEVAVEMIHQDTEAMLTDPVLSMGTYADPNLRQLSELDNDKLMLRVLAPTNQDADNSDCHRFLERHRTNILGRENVFKALLESSDNNPNILGKKCDEGSSLLIKLLITQPCRIPLGSSDDEDKAPHMPNVSAVRALINAGANLDAGSVAFYSQEENPHNNHVLLAQTLIETNNDATKAFEIALDSHSYDVAHWLLTAGADPIPSFRKSIEEKDELDAWELMIMDELICKHDVFTVIDAVFRSSDTSRIDDLTEQLTNKLGDYFYDKNDDRNFFLINFALAGNDVGIEKFGKTDDEILRAAKDIAEMPDISKDKKLAAFKSLHGRVTSDKALDEFLVILKKSEISSKAVIDEIFTPKLELNLEILERGFEARDSIDDTLVNRALNKIKSIVKAIFEMGGNIADTIALLMTRVERHTEANQPNEAQAAQNTVDIVLSIKDAIEVEQREASGNR